MSDFFAAISLGLLEGLTEFIPVSSTGHMILLGDAIGFEGERAQAFQVFIQLGAILAVVWLYSARFLALLPWRQASGQSGGFSGWAGVLKLALGCLPAFVAGFLWHDFIKTNLFSSELVAYALIVGGLVMILVDRPGQKKQIESVEQLSFWTCLGIGIFQCFALWPGMSRSGSTIIGGLLLGCHRKVAAEYSFLVAVPVMCAAVAYDLYKSMGILSANDLQIFAIGFLVAFVTAIFAVKFFIAVLNRVTLAPFGYYRILLGVLVLWFYPFG